MPKKLIAVKFGHIVRHLRTKQSLSQEDFAILCGLHRTYIGSIERGEKTVTIETAYKIAKALNVSLADIFTELETQIGSDIND